ncbi:MAG TPA: hypothetical protein EYG03_27550 [Planctomycetes bacterium]|nr:hypothetical protein [Fuerstiella sp.]HIK95718.1 hypothetical protein [Planctomycetota bacterium]
MNVHELAHPLLETRPEQDKVQGTASAAIEPPLFSELEVQHFRDEDQAAGRAVAKILVSLFLYTLFIMLFVIWWTFRTVG